VTALAAPDAVRVARVRPGWLAVGVAAVALAGVAGITIGAVSLAPSGVVAELVGRLPWVDVDSGLDTRQAAIVWQIRLPRVVLALLVGAMLASAGTAYQGVFRNPLADPYLLGAAAGAGLGATLAIAGRASGGIGPLDAAPVAAFAGALGAVLLSYFIASVGSGGSDRSPAVLLLAGVAVAAFLTAIQTFVQQRNADTVREVYTWLLGRLGTSGWSEVLTVLPYFVLTTTVLLLCRRTLDVLSVGDDEAATLGVEVGRARLLVVGAASLATAAAVSVSGLIGFVGIVVPHTVRLIAGTSYRVILPLSLLFGAAFLAGADLLARTILAPAEVPIGVVTAVFGAPFFAVVLRTRRRLSA
jgi:iron complex transport system permease protein